MELPLRFLACTLPPLHGFPLTSTDTASCRGGMIAPILGGTLLMVNTSFPVYTSICVFTLSGVAVLLLSEDAGDTKGREGGPVIVH